MKALDINAPAFFVRYDQKKSVTICDIRFGNNCVNSRIHFISQVYAYYLNPGRPYGQGNVWRFTDGRVATGEVT